MRPTLVLILFLLVGKIQAQVEFVDVNYVIIDESMQWPNVALTVKNTTNSTINFDWEVKYHNQSDEFLGVSVSDLVLGYPPNITNNCDFIHENILPPLLELPMGLQFVFDEVPSSFNRDSLAAEFILYSDGECFIDTLTILPIYFESTTSILETETSILSIYPNPCLLYTSPSPRDA